MQATSETSASHERRPAAGGRKLGIFFGVLALAYVVGSLIGGEAQAFMTAGLEVWPFMLLAMLAYLGTRQDWAKVATLL